MYRTVAKPILAVLLACALSAGTAIAPSVRQSATGSVTIWKPISASRTAILDFGRFRNAGTNCTPGTITLDPRTGARSTTGSVTLGGGKPAAGAYSISGSANSIYGVSFPASALSSPNLLRVTAFRFYSVTDKSPMTGKIGPGGTDTPLVGATISVPCPFERQTGDEVAPSFTLTVNYQ